MRGLQVRTPCDVHFNFGCGYESLFFSVSFLGSLEFFLNFVVVVWGKGEVKKKEKKGMFVRFARRARRKRVFPTLKNSYNFPSAN